MRCHRCKGIMSYEIFYGAQDHFWGWRCICCGEIIDPAILENRGPMVPGSLRGWKRRRHSRHIVNLLGRAAKAGRGMARSIGGPMKC